MAQLGSIGTKLDLLIKQGATFGPYTVDLTDENEIVVDITGAIIRSQIRKNGLSSTIVATFTTSVINGASGIFDFQIPYNVTSEIPAGENVDDSQYMWDMEMQLLNGSVIPLFYGNVSVHRNVTR